MDINISDSTEPSELVLKVLSEHSPYSLPTLRRIQFLKFTTAQTSHSHVLSTFDKVAPENDFLVACLDFSKGPNTEMWLYSSIENPVTSSDEAICEEQVLKLLRRVREIENVYEAQRETPGVLLIGSLHETVLQILEKHSLVKSKSPKHFKFIFKMQNLPSRRQLPKELSWASAGMTDIPLVLSRTSIPYTEATMKRLRSVAIESNSGVPIAWAFLGPDGSLKTLHCEKEYRGQGFAKAVTLKLFHEKTADLASDGLFHADVALNNFQSQGLCKSLNGTVEWSIYYVWIALP